MKFGKRAYMFDRQYAKLKTYIEAYNADNSSENESALLDAAFNYVDKNSTGKEAKHKGRTARAEDIITQLTMKGGTQAKAIGNIDRLKGGMAHQQGDDPTAIPTYARDMAGGTAMFDEMKKTMDPTSGYSPAMRMITAGVMADQDQTTQFRAGGSSNSKQIYAPGRTSSHYEAGGRTEGTLSDALGTSLHELTHISVGKSYGNTGMFVSAPKTAKSGALLAERDERVKRMGEIQGSFETAPSNIRAAKGLSTYSKELVDDRAKYSTERKMLTKYAALERGKLLKDERDKRGLDSPEADEEMMSLVNSGGLDADFQEIDSDSTSQLSKGYVGSLKADDKQIQSVHDAFSNEESVNVKKLQAVTDKMYAAQAERRKLKAVEGYESTSAYRKIQKQCEKLEQQQHDLTPKSVSHSDSLVEYDPVVNQMLVQYEHDSTDRTSEHYRKLKAAALRSHVQRMKAKLSPGQ